MNKKYLLFDIDGTLIDSGGAGKNAMLMAFEKILGDGSLVKRYAFAGKTDTQIIKDMVLRADTKKTRIDEIIENVEKAYIKNLKNTLKKANKFTVYPYVREFLESCNRINDFELALLTGNLYNGAKLKLEHADLWKYFSWGAFGDISEDRVHLAEEAYRIIAQKDGKVTSRDIIIIGDTSNDVRCGKAIHATTVAIVSGFEPEETIRVQRPDFIIHSFKELYGLLDL